MKAKTSRFAFLIVAGGLAALAPLHAQTNTSTGVKAGAKVKSGKHNTADGFTALQNNKTGSFNTAVGSKALTKSVGSNNVAIGFESLFNNKGGDFNVAIGDGAMKFNVGGNNNVALGMDAGALTTGSDNILIDHVGVAGQSGTIRIGTPGTHQNTFIAGKIFGDGSGLTGIPSGAISGAISGAQIAPASITSEKIASNTVLTGTVTIGSTTTTTPGRFSLRQDDASEALVFRNSYDAIDRMAIGRDGDVGIGTNNPTAKLDVRGDVKLGGSGQYQATASEEKLRIVRGRVDINSNILSGSGFTAVRLSTGVYRISFTSGFPDVPAVTCSGNYLNIDAYVIDAGQGRFDVHQFNSSTNTPADAGFSFIAAGTR
jgi:hypothetical protein